MDRLENILQKNNLEESYNLLTKRERKVITLYYLEGYKNEEIARFSGISQQAVNKSRKKGINKLMLLFQ
ncbi:LuxR C-terminal-related transcriptional regulator [bacterium]|nr:LuxR C-terminal-related transcriptional regulator [bacterium]MBU4510261.1 LuxR C-terminal-related transcriptional regulator [bacterium]